MARQDTMTATTRTTMAMGDNVNDVNGDGVTGNEVDDDGDGVLGDYDDHDNDNANDGDSDGAMGSGVNICNL